MGTLRAKWAELALARRHRLQPHSARQLTHIAHARPLCVEAGERGAARRLLRSAASCSTVLQRVVLRCNIAYNVAGCVIGRNCKIGDYARLNGCYLFDNVTVARSPQTNQQTNHQQ